MTARCVICLVIYALVAFIMMEIEVTQLKSRKSVGFYSGEEEPKQEELTDVAALDKNHGTMWVIFMVQYHNKLKKE